MPGYLWEAPHRFEETQEKVSRMRAGEPDPVDARHVVNRLQQPAEVARRIVGRRVVVHDLPEQLDLAATLVRRVPNLRQDVSLGTHPLMAAGVGYDAEAAELVAPLDDRHVGLHGIGSPRHPAETTPRRTA